MNIITILETQMKETEFSKNKYNYVTIISGKLQNSCMFMKQGPKMVNFFKDKT